MSYSLRLFFRCLFLPWIRLIYRVRRSGEHHVPAYGGALLIPNHVSFIDAFVIYVASPRPLRFIIADHFVEVKTIGWFLRIFEVIPIDRTNPRDAITKSVDALSQGHVVCLFAEGGLTRSGLVNDLKKGFQVIAKRAQCPVIPCYMDGLFYSIFSFERGTYIKKWPRKVPCPVQVVFGRPIVPEEATIPRVFEGILDASVEAFGMRRCFDQNLEAAVIRGLKKKKGKNLTYEYAKEPRRWKRAEFLGLATAIARRWMHSPPDDRDRIGILLPPGPTPGVITLGLFLAGKVPVNLPFDLSPYEVEKVAETMDGLGIRTVITSKAFMPHLVDFWRGEEGRFIDIRTELMAPGGITLNLERMFAFLEPTWMTLWRLELRQRDRNREAIGLFSDAREAPAFLTSSEVHRNAVQLMSGSFIRDEDTILSEIPLNRAAGQMLQLWVPILNRGRSVSRGFSARKEDALLRALAEGQKVNVLAGDLPFYQGIEKPLELSGLRVGMVFDRRADSIEIEIREDFLHLPLAHCWEFAGRIVTVSLPPEVGAPPHHLPQMCRARGSVGRFLPGIGARVTKDGLLLRFEPSLTTGKVRDLANRPNPESTWIPAGYSPYIDDKGFLFLEDPSLARSEPGSDPETESAESVNSPKT